MKGGASAPPFTFNRHPIPFTFGFRRADATIREVIFLDGFSQGLSRFAESSGKYAILRDTRNQFPNRRERLCEELLGRLFCERRALRLCARLYR